MEKKTCFYENLFVISGALSEEDAKAFIPKVGIIGEGNRLV